MNILVTGANGQLGNAIRKLALRSHHKFIFTDIVQAEGVYTTNIDINDSYRISRLVEDYEVVAIINCAAYTNVDAAESNPELAEKLNADGPEVLAKIMKEYRGLLIHISTDYVFGAESYNTPCTEDCEGTPTGVYGRTKLLGEQKIQAVGGDYVIIRTSWLYSEYGNNFCKTMLKLTTEKPYVDVVFDQVGTPTYASNLAEAIIRVLEDYFRMKSKDRGNYPKTGIYNYSDEGVCSWYDFACQVADISRHYDCTVRAIHSDEFPSPVKRPSYSVLDKTKIKKTFGVRVPYWAYSLGVCIDHIKKNKSKK